ncbi:MAG TPA: GNAT family N-acetyltransferase [Fibrobacteria bacterium]|nr:GNAT family N-acetyltransferase [Fibrobacteria bacterium]HOX51064.1 GNAT family N-acetyltransferase [Fibrobacteria bacterium]
MESASIQQIADLELLAHRTWPSRIQESLGPWILRGNDGFTRRANSCLALGHPGADLESAIDQVESWYRKLGVEPCFKICAGAPDGLDALLERRGWPVATPTKVMAIAPTGTRPTSPELHIRLTPDDRWLDHLSRWDGECATKAKQHAALLGRVDHARFASWESGEEILAVGFCAMDGDRGHLYDLVVRQDLRGQGIGTRFFQSLLDHCYNEGAKQLYLQVLEENRVACRLYHRLGFSEHHRYHYRIAPWSASATTGC